MTEGKACNKCKVFKIFEEFHNSKRYKDGKISSCKECMKEYQQLNRDKTKEYEKEYRQLNKDKIKEQRKEHRQLNNSKIKEYMEEYYRTNKVELKERAKKYGQLNKDRVKEYQQSNKIEIKKRMKEYSQTEAGRLSSYRRSMKRRSYKHKVVFKPHERKQILDRDNWTCQCCGIKVHDESTDDWNTPKKCHIDHIIPISKGGDSTPKNLRVLCRTCNLTKSNKENEQLRFFN